jgi:hypothetical protein
MFQNYTSNRKLSFLHGNISIDSISIESILANFPNVKKVNSPLFRYLDKTINLNGDLCIGQVMTFKLDDNSILKLFNVEYMRDNTIFLYDMNETPTIYDPLTFEPVKFKLIRMCVTEKYPNNIDLLE